MAEDIEHPHDRLFRRDFSNAAEAAGLLRSVLPRHVSDEIDWNSLRLLEGTFLEGAPREKEADLLFEVGIREGKGRTRLYILFQHPSTPDATVRVRLLGCCLRIWDADRQDNPGSPKLRSLLPVVLFPGTQGRRHSTEFTAFEDVFPKEFRKCSWVPRFKYLLGARHRE